MTAFTADDVRAAEAPLLATERGFAGGLMDRAAAALATGVRRELRAVAGRVRGTTVVGLVGPGNNGGDTLHALARLAPFDVRAIAVLTAERVHEGGLAALRRAGGRVLVVRDGGAGRRAGSVDAAGPDDADAADDGARGSLGRAVWFGDALAEAFAADVLLDGLLGVGGSGGLRGPARLLVEALTELCAGAGRPPRRPTVVAVDVPSGIGVDDGTRPGPVLPADLTVTFGVAKPGLLLPPAERAVGRLTVVPLGLGRVLAAQGARPRVVRLDTPSAARSWPVPQPDQDKYRRGVVGVIAGSDQYPGAAVLTVAGALGAGCGMVRYVGPDAVARQVLTAHPEVVVGPGRVQAWVIGPGIGDLDRQWRRDLIRPILRQAHRDRTPVVLDAGMLDPGVLETYTRAEEDGSDGLLGPATVLTPHAGELAALVGRSREEVEAEPYRWARRAQRDLRCTVLLKGATTLVVGPDACWSQAEGPAWLATAGAGDVLAGVLGALLAGRAEAVGRGAESPGRLAALAALVHGRAAHPAGPGPVTASRVAEALSAAVADLLGEQGPPSGPRLPGRAR